MTFGLKSINFQKLIKMPFWKWIFVSCLVVMRNKDVRISFSEATPPTILNYRCFLICFCGLYVFHMHNFLYLFDSFSFQSDLAMYDAVVLISCPNGDILCLSTLLVLTLGKQELIQLPIAVCEMLKICWNFFSNPIPMLKYIFFKLDI
jgi:hypothetical protein